MYKVLEVSPIGKCLLEISRERGINSHGKVHYQPQVGYHNRKEHMIEVFAPSFLCIECCLKIICMCSFKDLTNSQNLWSYRFDFSKIHSDFSLEFSQFQVWYDWETGHYKPYIIIYIYIYIYIYILISCVCVNIYMCIYIYIYIK